ncbi:VWA domain-containing protein [Candidatus Micrarchaeota archaeon]|nr:VWA domain-containing protein [Candidatus Micrarchaeota archaeon]
MKSILNSKYIVVILFLFLASFAFSIDCVNSGCGDGYAAYEVGDSLRTDSYTVVFSIVMPSDGSVNFAIWDATATTMLELVNVPSTSTYEYGDLTIYLCETERIPRQEACIKVKEHSPLIVIPSEGRITEELICGVNITLSKGWNLFSSPVIGKEVDEIIFNSDLKIYSYSQEGKYTDVKTIKPLMGYWVYSEKDQTIFLTGDPVCGGKIELTNAGWNLIGMPYGGFTKEHISILEKYNIKNLYSYNLDTGNYETTTALTVGVYTNEGVFVKNPNKEKLTISIPPTSLCAEECRERPTTEHCGNGILEIHLGESCDDGNLINGDDCSENCLVECSGTVPLDIMLVIDTSNSMNMREIGAPLSRLDYAKESAVFFISTLNSTNDKVGLVTFGDYAYLRHVLTFEHSSVIVHINILTASGLTNLRDAIALAHEQFTSSHSRADANKVMIILSDGAPSYYAWDEADAAKADGIIIYTIDLVTSGIPHLSEIASSPSHYYSAPHESDLIGIYEQISEHITDCCGDGIHNEGEECDYMNPSGPPCDEECNLIPIPKYCGDEYIQSPNDDGQLETCDPPDSLTSPHLYPCRTDCTFCGDGKIDIYFEECDDANTDNTDNCLNTCLLSYCGDGYVQTPNSLGFIETCDPNLEGVIVWGPWDNPCRTTCTYCGDGEVQLDYGETCDNILDPLCRTDCTYCGDGNIDFSEECDDENIDPTDLCHECMLTYCGDGIVQSPNGYGFLEECDGGSGCFEDCTLMPIIYCGDNDIDPGESCEPPGSLGWGPHENVCREDCTYCGDGTTQTTAGEECDDGNANENDLCLNDCKFNICGDEIINENLFKIATGDISIPFIFMPYETCDPPGEEMPNDNYCREDCTYCGDGYIQSIWFETCDSEDYCRTDCTYCGDGITQREHGESCDGESWCREDCTYCGDMRVQEIHGESCDSQEWCREDCTYCGDEVIDYMWEDCDDGNDNNYDDCTNECLLPRCGDEYLHLNLDETCDPPGTETGPYNNPCRNDCTYCGDGIIQPTLGFWINLESSGPEYIIFYEGESCEPMLNKSCRTDCTYCGDGITQREHGESCDGDSWCREDCTYCGDMRVQEINGEECDDGNRYNEDECLDNCQRPYCGDGYIQSGIMYYTEAGEIINLDETCDGEEYCRDDCTFCGDGIIQDGEACDGEEYCRDDCTMCGDEQLQLEYGEECDDGNTDNTDYCTNECKLATCGDGYIQEILGETCDGEDISSCRDFIINGIEMTVEGCECCNCLYDVELYNASYFDCSVEPIGECFYNDDCLLYPYEVCVRDTHNFASCEFVNIFGSDLDIYMDPTNTLIYYDNLIKHNSRRNTFISKLNELTYEISWEDGGRGTCDDVGTSIYRYGGFIQLILNNISCDYNNSILTKLHYSDIKRLEFDSDYATPFIDENNRFLIQLWDDVHDVPLNSKFNFTINETSDCKCGNGILEAGEDCDEGLNNGMPCVPFFNGTCNMCSNLCTYEELSYEDENVWLVREDIKLERGKTYTNQFKIVNNNLVFDCNGAVLNGYPLPSYKIGIEVFEQNNITIKNCHIQHYDIGLYAFNSDYLKLENNHVAENNEQGIYVLDSEHIFMNGNEAGGNTREGIYLKEVDHSIINHTTTIGNIQIGLRLDNSHNNRFNYITSNNNLNSVLLSSSNDNIINGVYISNNIQTGLSLVTSSNNFISEGYSNSNNIGVGLTYGSISNEIKNLEIVNNFRDGVSIRRESNNNKFIDNNVCDNLRYAFHTSVNATYNIGNNICNNEKILDDVGTNTIYCSTRCS